MAIFSLLTGIPSKEKLLQYLNIEGVVRFLLPFGCYLTDLVMYIDYLIYNTIFKFVVKNEIMKSTFSLSFFLKRTVRNKNGEMPIIGRITVNGNAVEFRPHLSIKSELWSVAKGKAIGRSAEIVQLNTMLNSIRKVISAHYQTLSAEDGYVTAEKIREAYLGQDERTLKRVAEEKRGKTTLIDFFGKFNAEYKLKVDAKLVTKRTYSRYVLTKERLIDFMKQKYKVEDIPLCKINIFFIEGFYLYLCKEHECTNNTSMKFKLIERIILNNPRIPCRSHDFT